MRVKHGRQGGRSYMVDRDRAFHTFRRKVALRRGTARIVDQDLQFAARSRDDLFG
jgi:hypothetical protein